MQHQNCSDAISALRREKCSVKSNVHEDPSRCKCTHDPSPCAWVGNSQQYACLRDKSTEPKRVYTHFNATKAARIQSPTRSGQ